MIKVLGSRQSLGFIDLNYLFRFGLNYNLNVFNFMLFLITNNTFSSVIDSFFFITAATALVSLE